MCGDDLAARSGKRLRKLDIGPVYAAAIALGLVAILAVAVTPVAAQEKTIDARVLLLEDSQRDDAAKIRYLDQRISTMEARIAELEALQQNRPGLDRLDHATLTIKVGQFTTNRGATEVHSGTYVVSIEPRDPDNTCVPVYPEQLAPYSAVCDADGWKTSRFVYD